MYRGWSASCWDKAFVYGLETGIRATSFIIIACVGGVAAKRLSRTDLSPESEVGSSRLRMVTIWDASHSRPPDATSIKILVSISKATHSQLELQNIFLAETPLWYFSAHASGLAVLTHCSSSTHIVSTPLGTSNGHGRSAMRVQSQNASSGLMEYILIKNRNCDRAALLIHWNNAEKDNLRYI
jgi:hypothetical protein